MNRRIIALGLAAIISVVFLVPAYAIEKKFDYRTTEKINKAVERLSDKKVSVRRQAKKDLIKWGEAAVEPLLAVVKDWRGKDADLRVLCVDTLGEIKDKRAVPVIISVLEEKKMTMRYNAARALGKIGDNKATPPLIKLLKDTEWEVRFFTAEALGKIGDDRAAKPLANVALSDSQVKVRLVAIQALDNVEGKSEYKAVIGALSDNDPEIRSYAAELSASWNIEDSLPIITGMLKDDRANITRASCAHALGVYNNIATVPALIEALGDDYKDVRIYALESLKKISGQSYGFNKDKWNHWFELNKAK
ncbi:MAG: HEAT repeat domain-containing protein [Candidatus Omnitrophica bacterium]|nr:HEAT repeat domain-containing protein [Candidatus Omnitrophota bacterium]